jgi:hypothetical protein
MKKTTYIVLFIACLICSGETPYKRENPTIQELEQRQLDNQLKLKRLDATF